MSSRRSSVSADTSLELLKGAGMQLELLAKAVKVNNVQHSIERTTAWIERVREIAGELDQALYEAEICAQSIQDLKSTDVNTDIDLKDAKENIATVTSTKRKSNVETFTMIISEIIDNKKKRVEVDEDFEEIESALKEIDFICQITQQKMEIPMKK
jgi:hypothetical protein